MKSLYLIIAIIFIGVSVNAQSTISKKDSTINAFKNYISKKTRYPAVARENEVQGDVAVCFKVGKDKKISESKIVKGLSQECDSATLLSIRKFSGRLELHSKKYTIGLHYRIQKLSGMPIDSIVPFNGKLYQRFLFETNIIGYGVEQKKTITITEETIHK